MSSPYSPSSPEHRVWELARHGTGKTESEVLEAAGWVPHDGTLLRDELITQYGREAALADRFTDGIRRHAITWASDGMRADLDVALAYSDHMAAMYRSGEMTTGTSHKTEYPRWLAAHEVKADAELEAGA